MHLGVQKGAEAPKALRDKSPPQGLKGSTYAFLEFKTRADAQAQARLRCHLLKEGAVVADCFVQQVASLGEKRPLYALHDKAAREV